MTLAKVWAFVGPGTMTRIILAFVLMLVADALAAATLNSAASILLFVVAFVWWCREIYVRKRLPDAEGYVALTDNTQKTRGSGARVAGAFAGIFIITPMATMLLSAYAGVVVMLGFFAWGWYEIYVRKRMCWPAK